MTDQTVIASVASTAIPTLAVFLVYFLNKRDVSDLRAEVRQDLQGMRAEIAQFRQEINQRFALIHSDISTLVNVIHDLDKRVSKLEDAS